MNLLGFDDLQIPLGDGDRVVRLSGRLPHNSILAVTGPSGAGKSTLLRILGRLEDRFSGTVLWRDRPMETVPAGEWRRRIQYVHQTPVTFAGSVRDNLLYPWQLAAFRKEPLPEPERLARELAALGLSAKILEQDAQLLSGGERARIVLLRHLLSGPEILLLDEPTASLDPDSRNQLLDRLKAWICEASGRGLCLVSHSRDQDRFPAERVQELSLLPLEVRP